jgi:putative transposase
VKECGSRVRKRPIDSSFSVSQSKLPEVKEYIAGQEEHHRKIGFQDELRALLRKHEIEWDEKYVWD